jgi:hypothetical protein
MSERKNPHQFVTVGSSGEELLTNETNCLSGAPIGEREEQTIRWAIDNLSGFIGGAPPINKPAMPNGSCDCGASSAATMREAAAKMADDVANGQSTSTKANARLRYEMVMMLYGNFDEVISAIHSQESRDVSRDGEIAELRAEVTRLHERLEDNHVFVWDKATDKMLRQEIEPGSSPDGIECRDATIKLQGAVLAEARATISALRSAVAKAREALEPFARTPIGIVDEGDQLLSRDPDGTIVYQTHGWPADQNAVVVAGDLRRARSALAALMKVKE